MKESNKCPNCGASVKYNDEKTVAKCPYCNSSFDIDNEKPTQTATIKDLQVDESAPIHTDKRPKFNLFIFIILFMFAPYLAIVYAIVKIIKIKVWDDKNKR